MDRLVYLSNSIIPFRTANSVQVMRMCAAFAGEGLAVTLWHEAGDRALGDPFAWYGVEPRFALRRYPDRESGGRLRRRAGRLVRRTADTALPAYLGLAVRPRFVYGRSLPQVARWLRSPWARHARTGLELHVPPERPALLRLLREAAASPHLAGLVAISPRLRAALLTLMPGFPPERILVAPSAAETTVPVLPAAPNVDLEGRFRLGYAGGLNAGAGIETVAAAIRGLDGVALHVAGGTPDEVAALRARLPADAVVRWHGLLPPAGIPGWLAACDALVAPYTPDARTHAGTPKAEWMSPLKLFEYMAACRPILASNLPAVADVLADQRTALLVDPADPSAWRQAVTRLRDEPGLCAQLGAAALAELRGRPTWQTRAHRILAFLEGVPARR